MFGNIAIHLLVERAQIRGQLVRRERRGAHQAFLSCLRLTNSTTWLKRTASFLDSLSLDALVMLLLLRTAGGGRSMNEMMGEAGGGTWVYAGHATRPDRLILEVPIRFN
jgi:hypothetical protein